MRIAVIDDYNGAAAGLDCWGKLPPECEVTFFADHVAAPEQLVERLAGFTAVVCMRERSTFTDDVLGQLTGLKLLVTTGMKNASIDIAAAGRLGITVCGTRMPQHPAGEMTWALILELARRAGAQDAALRSGVWQDGVGIGLEGRTLGVVGLGRLGRHVARVGAAFGMNVLAWSPNLTPERAAEAGEHVRAVSKAELFGACDVVSVHMKLSESTTGLIGTEEFRAMRPTAYFVNTSRGPLVDENALVTALREGWIGGAGLDVHDVEPLPADHVLRQTRNTVLTPHIGYVTVETYRLAYGDAVDDITGFLAGEPVRVLNA